MIVVTHTLQKAERLSRKKAIERLFSGGNLSFSAYPFRAVFCVDEQQEVPARILVSIPKHRMHHAVDRNRMKRLVREAYRLNKDIIWKVAEEMNITVDIAFICISDRTANYREVKRSVCKILQRTADAILKN